MKTGTDGKFLAWKQGDGLWYSFDEASQTWTVLPGQESEENKAGDTFTIPDLSLEMLWVEPGTFNMGISDSEAEIYWIGNAVSYETQHQVTLTQGFYLGKYEVTQAQYEVVMTGNTSGLSATPSYFLNNPNRPVEQVSYDDIQVFLTRLNDQEASNIPAGWAYVLPTEAEWEYACRAGTTTAHSWGDTISSTNANYDGSGIGQTRDVGQYAANPWGFFDMHGNVWEWTADWFSPYSSNAQTDPTGPASGTYKSLRGGAFDNVERVQRSAFRSDDTPPGYRHVTTGFRIGFKKVQ